MRGRFSIRDTSATESAVLSQLAALEYAAAAAQERELAVVAAAA